MLYHNPTLDRIALTDYINTFASRLDKQFILPLDSEKIRIICSEIHEKFPCSSDTLGEHIAAKDKANVFKKAAHFVATFLHYSPLDRDSFNEYLADYKHIDANAIIALNVSFQIISQAKVVRSDKKEFVIDKGIQLSKHSRMDILDTLSNNLNNHGSNFMWLSILFEQIVYKNHGSIQYDIQIFAKHDDNPRYSAEYSQAKESEMKNWDDLIDFYKDLL